MRWTKGIAKPWFFSAFGNQISNNQRGLRLIARHGISSSSRFFTLLKSYLSLGDGSSLRESLEPLEGVVDENPVLVGGRGRIVTRSGHWTRGDLEVNVGKVVEVGRVINGLYFDRNGSGSVTSDDGLTTLKYHSQHLALCVRLLSMVTGFKEFVFTIWLRLNYASQIYATKSDN